MKKNKLPTNKEFIDKFVKYIEFLGDTIYETWIGLKYFYYCI